MGKSPAKAVIFDLGRVLVNYDTRKTCKALAAYTHLSLEEIHDAMFTGVGLKTIRQPYEIGAFDCDSFFKKVCEHIHLKEVEFEEFSRHWGDIIGPPDGTHDLVRRIPSDITMGILSNIDPLNWAVAEYLPMISENFLREYWTLSFAEKCAKPDEAIYLTAAKRVSHEPAAIVYVDDRPENVEAAAKLGMKAEQYNCLLEPVSNLERILQKHGVLA